MLLPAEGGPEDDPPHLGTEGGGAGLPMHGQAEHTYENGGHFVGVWHLGRAWAGQMTRGAFPGILLYTGYVNQGVPDTQDQPMATAAYENGDAYEGHFISGQRAGEGRLCQREAGPAGQGVFEGLWKHDAPWEGTMEGMTLCSPSGRYTGSMQAGRRHGGGSLFGKDGTVFVGEFRRGEKSHGELLPVVHAPPSTQGVPNFNDVQSLSTVQGIAAAIGGRIV